MRVVYWIALGFLFLFQGCRTPFDPEIPARNNSLLVVEGYLDTEGKKSELKLSKTVSLGSETTFSPEVDASVQLVSSNGQTFELEETTPGTYIFESDIEESNTYILEVILRNGDRFQSESLQPIITPEILDIGFQKDEEGVEVFISTKGDDNADDFLWTYEEAWIYRPRIRVPYIYDERIRDVRDRSDEEQIALCFKRERSPDILLETSSRFQEQVVFKKTITEIPTGNERIMERYSILVSQKAIEQDAVKFWEILKKNTEDIGSIFSPLPSLIGGNVYSVDDQSIPVIGQVSLGVVRERRIYINLTDVSPWGYLDPQFNNCIIEQEAVLKEFYDPIFTNPEVLPARPLIPPGGTVILGYFATDKRCADCTLYASRVKPDFWEDE